MGVRGLTTYVAEHADRYLVPFELYNCNVVIDGDSLTCYLYKSVNSAFGGDYDHYFRAVCNFFNTLNQCNVTPYVLLDGGYELKKVNTVKQRLRSKIGAIKHLNPSSNQSTFPIMMREVFIEAMDECGVRYMRCTFEADDEVAALSRKLKCPVLSYDSDFYIHNVTYIPLVSLNLKISKRKIADSTKKPRQPSSDGDNTNSQIGKKPVIKECYIKCLMYQIANLAEQKKLRSEMLPLFAILLGNDFISSSIFKKFYLNVSMQKTGKNNTRQGKRIIALLRWLQNETVVSAVDKIINHVEKDKKVWLREQINLGISGYNNEKSLAYEYFGFSNGANNRTAPPQVVEDRLTVSDDVNIAPVDDELGTDSDDNEDSQSESNEELQSDSADSKEEDQSENEDDQKGLSEGEVQGEVEGESKEEETTHLNFEALGITASTQSVYTPPDWLLAKILSGKLPRYILDLITLRLYINSPQVENFLLPDCNRISLPILQLIFTILPHSNWYFRYLTRIPRRIDIEFKRIERLEIDTHFDAQRPENFETFSLILNDFQDLDSILTSINEKVPADLRLLFIAIIYWSRHSKHFNVVHISSLLLCQIELSTLDSKVQIIRDPFKFEKFYKTSTLKVTNKKRDDKESSEATIESLQQEISQTECIFAQTSLIPAFIATEKLEKKHTEFSSDIIHGFAEFQSIVYHINCLNVLCGEPYPCIQMSKCFNGCFLYNMYNQLKQRPNIKYYIEKFLLPKSPTVFNLYETMMTILTPFIDCLSKETISKRRKRNNKKKPKTEKTAVQSVDNVAAEQSDSEFEDLNNKFSCLLKVA